jgi:hypothetical protein
MLACRGFQATDGNGRCRAEEQLATTGHWAEPAGGGEKEQGTGQASRLRSTTSRRCHIVFY